MRVPTEMHMLLVIAIVNAISHRNHEHKCTNPTVILVVALLVESFLQVKFVQSDFL